MADKEHYMYGFNSHRNIIKNELQLLLNQSRLRGKILVNQILDTQQLIVLAHLQTPQQIFPSQEEIQISISFPIGYPYEAPQVSLKSRLLPHIYHTNNIINTQQWKPNYRIVNVIFELYKEIQKEGLKDWISSRFGQQQNIIFSHRHNKIGMKLNQNIQPQYKFGSAFRLFRQNDDNFQFQENKVNSSELSFSSQADRQKIEGDISNQYKKTAASKKIDKKNRKQTKPMNKNANLPKFLIRIFIKYLDRFKDVYVKKHYDKLMSECRKMKEWKKNDRRQHAFGLKHLIRFFNVVQDGLPTPDLNRKVITGIISRFLLEEICQNSQIPQSHRVGYLIACKVYALRCRNPSLASRIQSK